jgi:ATP-dependent Lon protease
MSGSSVKKHRKVMQKAAKEVYSKQHLSIIRGYIDGIIDLPWRKRRKVCWAIMKKRNPFGKSPEKKDGKK